ncbi:uncharacterized protein [Primulina huaijiensis]|uniref:uncharacterized protein n=1 Tax=Primulina huaijiensis TaxID=1492673 RepID=UPI003CC6E9B4
MGEMELVISRFQNMRPPRFFGNEDGENAVAWLKSMKRLFNMLEDTPDLQLKLAICQLKDRAQLWWETTEEALKESGERVTWDVFCSQFAREYSPPSYYSAKEAECNRLTQGNMTVVEYASQFSALLAYVPHVASSDRNKLSHFMQGLNRTICTLVAAGAPVNYADVVEKAKNVEASLLLAEPQSVQPYFPQSFGGNVPMPVGAPLYRPLLLYQPSQSYQQPKQQHFKAKGKQFKKQSSSSSSSSGSQRGGSVGSPGGVFCDRCGGKHISTQCTGVHGSCNICGQVGHYARVCPNAARQQFQQPQFGQGFRGPATRPFVPPQSFQQSSYPQPRGFVPQSFPGPQQAQVHALTQDQVQDAPGGVIADTVSVSTPAGVCLMSYEIILNCVIRFDDNVMITNLINLDMSDFDCILGMDTLSNYRATVDCFHGVVRFRPYYGSKWNFYGSDSQLRIPLVSAMEMFRILSSGNEGFMIYPVDATQGKGFEVSDIPVVKEFPDVFPDEIPGFPPQREIDFSIELVSETNPISRAPYRLAPAELKELKEQLQDLLEKGYIRPSMSPWGAPRRWMELLKDFDCEIQYQPGRMNLVADALSRKVQNAMLTSLTISKVHEHLGTSGWTYQISGDYFVVSSIQVEPQVLSRIKAAQRTDPHIHRLKELYRTGQTEKFSVASDGSLRFIGRLEGPNLIDLKEAILREAHCSRHSIHPGIRKMYHTLRAHYWWEGMKKDISHFVAKCLTCQQVKAERMRPGGMLHSLEVPQWNWEHIAMDFVTHIPRSNHGCDAIWVIVDRLSKSAHFIPYDRTCTYMKMAKLYIDHIVKLHGVPVTIVSDRDPRFASKFWGSLQSALGSKLAMSTAYHPQTDGQSERTIQTLEDMLRAVVMDFKGGWQESLSLVEFSYNNSFQYEPDPSHILNVEDVELDSSLSYVEHPVQILDRKERQLRSKTIPLVLVQWSRHGREESTWELEAKMRQEWPHLFENEMAAPRTCAQAAIRMCQLTINNQTREIATLKAQLARENLEKQEIIESRLILETDVQRLTHHLDLAESQLLQIPTDSACITRLAALNRDLLDRVEIERGRAAQAHKRQEEYNARQDWYISKLHGTMDRLQDQNNYLHLDPCLSSVLETASSLATPGKASSTAVATAVVPDRASCPAGHSQCPSTPALPQRLLTQTHHKH